MRFKSDATLTRELAETVFNWTREVIYDHPEDFPLGEKDPDFSTKGREFWKDEYGTPINLVSYTNLMDAASMSLAMRVAHGEGYAVVIVAKSVTVLSDRGVGRAEIEKSAGSGNYIDPDRALARAVAKACTAAFRMAKEAVTA